MKKADQKLIETQLPRCHIDAPIRIEYTYHCPNTRKDLDNISGYFHKVFQDALVCRGIIPDDGWKYIKGFSDDFCVDKGKPGVEIEIIKAGGD